MREGDRGNILNSHSDRAQQGRITNDIDTVRKMKSHITGLNMMCLSTLYFVWTCLRPYEINIIRLIPIVCNYTRAIKNVNYHLKAEH